MTPLVEAVARALCVAQGADPNTVVFSGVPGLPVYLWQVRQPEAEAAIKAVQDHLGTGDQCSPT